MQTKTIDGARQMTSRILAVLIAFSLAGMLPGKALGADQPEASDYLFPSSGRWSTSLITGAPYVGMVEQSIGVSKSFAVGFLLGMTPVEPALGLRPRFAAKLGKDTRLVLRVPIIYYPTDNLAPEPWALARPTLSYETKFTSGARFHVGGGLIMAACVDGILGLKADHQEEPSEMAFMGGVWNTLLAGGSLRAGKNSHVFLDFSIVLKGIKIAGDWPGIPNIIILGYTWGL